MKTIQIIILALATLSTFIIITACSDGGSDDNFTSTPPPHSSAFITTWNTALGNGDHNITIPTNSTASNFSVDWGDGIVEHNQTGDIEHTYGAGGIYTIKISGDFSRIYFNNSGSKDKIVSVDNWGDISWTTMESAFYGCTNLVINATDVPDLSNVIYLYKTFADASSLNQPIGDWNISNVTNISYMFDGASTFNQPIGNWDTSKVTEMQYMFQHASKFNQPIGDWNTSIVTSMDYMFFEASDFNQPIGNWDTSNVTRMMAMFDGAISFDQNISSWDTHNVITMFYMFNFASSFDQDIGNWDVSSVIAMHNMFFGVTLSTANYDSLLIGWDAQVLQNGVTFHGGNSIYTTGGVAEAARTHMINSDGWTITDGN